ncbi:hypothetical protein [Marinobacter sp. HL-58]|uniref:hypothetical protein n=1 Tax=Marinobacter sp. HL-58 TaxID=1479237 RepID=UPI00047F4605|nr:hypothetical protein [Marinobacter sp. HL-58]KPQ01911.1 MAG: hypothetical protein HLUCCO03_06365 [Marinobacter sp. HL-58]
MPTDAPVQLPPSKVSAADQTSSQSETKHCQQSKNATVVYVTGHRSFWVLPQNVLDKMETSAARLKAAASRETLEQRMAELEKVGLTDLFLPASAKSFLPPAEQSEWDELLSQNRDADRHLQRLDEELDKEEKAYRQRVKALTEAKEFYSNRLQLTAQWHQTRQGLDDHKKAIRAKKENRTDRLMDLQEQGFEAAREAGFHVVEQELFSPEQRSIKKMLSAYLEARKDFEEGELYNETVAAIFVNTCRLNGELMAYEWRQETPDIQKVEQYLTELNRMEGKMRDYADAVLALANIGIAAPEYALANGHCQVKDGILDMTDLRLLDWEIEQLTEEMKEHGWAWLSAIGMNGPAPAPEILQYQHKIETCQKKQDALRCRAQEQAKEMSPPKLFIWNPADYNAPPFKALVRPGVPLREFSRPGGASELQHFSLLDLPGGQENLGTQKEPESSFDIALSLKTEQKPGRDEALEKLLTDQGAKKYPLQESWFDNRGLFQPDRFFRAIQDDGVLEQYNAEELDAWGTHLRAFLFESEAKRHLMSFDDSYTGQFVRLLSSGLAGELSQELQNKLKVEVLTGVSGPASEPSFSMKNGNSKVDYELGEARIGANLTYSQGQLDLLSLKLPKPDEAEPIRIPYRTIEGSGELDLGRFYCEVDAKCWGFVGARILMSRSIGIEAVKGEGIQLTGVDWEKREVNGAEFEAFAGAQAGKMMRTEMKWSIPQRLRKSEKWRRLGEEVPEWITLGVLRDELVGAAGLGATGEVKIGMNNNRLVFYAKGRLVAGLGGGMDIGFELNFDSIPMLMRLLQQELHDNGYRRIYWIDDGAFEYLSMLMNLRLSAALNISFLAAQSYDFVQEVYRNFYSSENAGVVAVRITEAIDIAEGKSVSTDEVPRVTLEEYRSWFLGLQPEAIGPMLHNLVAEPVEFEGPNGERKSPEEMLKLQQISILQCCEWIGESELVKPESYRGAVPNRVQRQFEESVTRMNAQGTKPREGSSQVARENLARLDEFMGRDLASPLDSARLQKYKKLRRKFSLHLLGQV